MGMPKAWQRFCTVWLALPDQLAWAWWHGLSKAAWSDCVAFREAVLGYDQLPYKRANSQSAAIDPFVTPGHLVQMVEALVRQQLLLRRDGVRIQEAILAKLDRTGQWRYSPAVP
jgi:hypothetical protein